MNYIQFPLTSAFYSLNFYSPLHVIIFSHQRRSTPNSVSSAEIDKSAKTHLNEQPSPGQPKSKVDRQEMNHENYDGKPYRQWTMYQLSGLPNQLFVPAAKSAGEQEAVRAKLQNKKKLDLRRARDRKSVV